MKQNKSTWSDNYWAIIRICGCEICKLRKQREIYRCKCDNCTYNEFVRNTK